MEAAGLWVNKSVVLDPEAVKMKRVGVNIKKLKRNLIQNHLNDIEDDKRSGGSGEEKISCEMPGCGKQYESRDHYLTHLVINHFWSDISREFGESFNRDPRTCPVCRESFNSRSERMSYYKHLAVQHQVVIKYLENSKNRPRPEARTSIKLVNRLTPAVTSTPASTPLLRFSNETTNDETQSADTSASASLGTSTQSSSSVMTQVKTEVVETQENTSVTRNDDLVNKIRNVFSDDSDSDE